MTDNIQELEANVMTNNTEDDILKPVQLCVTNNGNHDWLPTTGKGMQCYSCPLCKQCIYWSEINKKWVKVTPKELNNGE